MLSVIVPVYNVEKFLSRCLDSIVDQTYKDLEILVINDASPDDSQKIIDEYAQKDPRIKVFIHEQNKGLGGARNTGLDHAKGKYIAFVDSDDFLDVRAYEKLIPILENENLDILSFGYFELKNNEKKEIPQKNIQFPVFSDKQKQIEYVFRNDISAIVCNKIYKKTIFEQLSFRFLEKTYYEDEPATLFFLIQATSFKQISMPFYYYCLQENSITQSKFTPKHLTDYIKIKKELEKIALQFSFSVQNQKLLENKILDHLIHIFRKYNKTAGEDYGLKFFIENFSDVLSPLILFLFFDKNGHSSFFVKIGWFYLRFVFFLQKNGIQKTIIKIINTIFRK